jgi:hypothetical protein
MISDTSQLWIATHSIGFLNALKQDHSSEADIIWFEGNFGSEKVSLFPIKKTRGDWAKIFQTALEDLTGLLAPRQIIYCEGKKEPSKIGGEQGLDADVYNLIFEGKYPDTLFVSSGGQTEPERYSEIAMLVLGKAFSGVEILVLRDKDINSDGSPTTDTDRASWLEGSNKRRMLTRKEVENYLLDFEIVRSAFPSTPLEDYEAVIGNVESEDVKANVSELMKLCLGGGCTSKRDFLLTLAKHIKPSTKVYSELESVIFRSLNN